MIWEELMANHSDILVDYTSLNETFTYSDIAATGADVLFFSDCTNEFTDDEVDAVSTYVNEGHGIIATFLTFEDRWPNNYDLAPLFGLVNSSSNLTYVRFSMSFNLLVSTHPIFNGITDSYVTGSVLSVPGMEVTLATKIAESTDELGFISAYAASTYSAVYCSHAPESGSGSGISLEDGLVVYNAIVWASAERVPPVAEAGPNQRVDEDTMVTFDGSVSDDNIGVVDYYWTFSDETQKNLTGVSPSYTFSTPGTYTVTLIVKDAAGNSDTDTIEITVEERARAEEALAAFPLEYIMIIVVVIAIIAGLLYYFKKLRPNRELGIAADKTKILAPASRYCMGCGTKMPAETQRSGECGNCGAKVTDFRGTPLWTCKECKGKGRETYNPFNAKFCPECGASKPE
jgi:putative hemolysin